MLEHRLGQNIDHQPGITTRTIHFDLFQTHGKNRLAPLLKA